MVASFNIGHKVSNFLDGIGLLLQVISNKISELNIKLDTVTYSEKFWIFSRTESDTKRTQIDFILIVFFLDSFVYKNFIMFCSIFYGYGTVKYQE